MDRPISARSNRAKQEFYQHLTKYLIFSVLFVVLNLLFSPYSWWFFWPIFGWGIAIANHAFRVFGADAYEEAEERHERRMKIQSRRRQPSHYIDHEEELRLDQPLRKPLFHERDLV